MITKEDVQNALADISGATAESVARNLKKKGVQGQPGNYDSCPVANYLRDVVGTHYKTFNPRLEVYTNEIVVEDVKLFETEYSDSIAEFIVRFDDGEFEELCVR